jgi:hypothetical protein
MLIRSYFTFLAIIGSALLVHSAQAMVFDNRFFPLIQYPWITVPCRESHASGDFFITTASRAADAAERDIGVWALWGPFDQAQLAMSMASVGLVNPLPPDYEKGELPWLLHGKLQTQGFAFWYVQELGIGFSAGILGMVMRSNSTIDFKFDITHASSEMAITENSQVFFLDEIRRQMLAELGLSCNHVHQHGFGDLETYVRWSDYRSYALKVRNVEYGLRLGLLIPTGVKKNIFEPASVPFGGNGHWGIYISGDAEFEVKEDWKFGVWLRLSKRFARTSMQRMPLYTPPPNGKTEPSSEPQIFGVIVGPASVDPGFTQVFAMYGEWEGLREGFGVRLQYTLINHDRDIWTDKRIDPPNKVNIKSLENHSRWASEYVTLTGFYDFDKTAQERGHKPIVRASWDIPFTLLVAHRFVKSFKISLGLEFNF